MNEERRKILELVAEGKLTPEQAETLMATTEAPRPDPEFRRGWLRNLGVDTELVIEKHLRELAPIPPAPPVPPRPPAPPAPGASMVRVRKFRRPGARIGVRPGFEHLVELAVHDVDAGFIEELREAGLEDLTVEEVVELARHGVDADYIKALREQGLTDLSVEELVDLAVHDVTPAKVRAYREAGLIDTQDDG